MSHLPTNPSESFMRRNPHIYGTMSKQTTSGIVYDTPKKRVRQSSKPPLNKLEQEYLDVRLKPFWQAAGGIPRVDIYAQAVTLRLCNGVRYTPDFFVLSLMQTIVCYEVKGFFRDDAVVKLKVAKAAYPSIRFMLVWKEKGQWKEQEILA